MNIEQKHSYKVDMVEKAQKYFCERVSLDDILLDNGVRQDDENFQEHAMYVSSLTLVALTDEEIEEISKLLPHIKL